MPSPGHLSSAFALLTLSLSLISIVRAAEPYEAFLQKHCVRCHGPEKEKGDLRFDKLSRDFKLGADTHHWAEAMENVNSGEMPPKKDKEPKPTQAEIAAFVTSLDGALKEGRASRLAARPSVAHYRLSRQEYQNTVYDLLGVRYDPTKQGELNEDTRWHGFERIGSELSLSPSHVDRYYRAAGVVLDRAFTASVEPRKVRKTAAELLPTGGKAQQAALDRFGIKRPLRCFIYPGAPPNHGPTAFSAGWLGQGIGAQHSGIYKVRIKASGIRPLGGQPAHLTIGVPGENENAMASRLLGMDITAPEDHPEVYESVVSLELPANLRFNLEASHQLSGIHTHRLFGSTVYTIIVTGGKNGAPDTIAWGDGKLFDTPHKGIPITGDWQELSHGVKIRFANKTGHGARSLWFVSYDAPEAYGIRIGHGLQKDTISGVRISGKGTIDLNASHNDQPSGLVKNINACVLIHGRVRNVLVEGITMTDTMRAVMMYGEHTGKFLPGGKVGPGESFDAENITVQFTRTLNPNGSGTLLGHPSFRGQLRNVRCNYNYFETKLTAIEPNFNLDGFEVTGNHIKSDGEAIHCWRHSKNGVIADNLRLGDVTFRKVISVNAPAGWEAPMPPVMKNNRNALGDRASGPISSLEPKPFGRRLLVSDYVGGKVAIVAANGRVEWSTPAEKPQDSWLLPNGNVLFSHVKGAKEVKPDQSVAWEYVADAKTEIQGCQPLADGRVLVVECGPGRLLEIGRDGKIAKEIKVPLSPTIRTHEQMRGCRKTADGRYLVSAKGDRAVLELSADGKLLRNQPVNGDIHDVRELANGNWLVALGEGDGVVEYDKTGKIVWNIGRNEVTDNPIFLASSVERLANGNTIVMNWLGHGHLGATAQIFEVDAQKKLIRQFTDHRQFTSINHIQVLE